MQIASVISFTPATSGKFFTVSKSANEYKKHFLLIDASQKVNTGYFFAGPIKIQVFTFPDISLRLFAWF